MNKVFAFENGDEVQDVVTGFKGIVRCRTEYDTGCKTYGLQSVKMKDGKPAEWIHLDETQLKLIHQKKVSFASPKVKGGPTHPSHVPQSRSLVGV